MAVRRDEGGGRIKTRLVAVPRATGPRRATLAPASVWFMRSAPLPSEGDLEISMENLREERFETDAADLVVP